MRVEQRTWLLCFIAVFMVASVMVPMPAQAQREGGGGGGGDRNPGRSCTTFVIWDLLIVWCSDSDPDRHNEIFDIVSDDEDAQLEAEEAAAEDPNGDVWCLIQFETGGIFCIPLSSA